MRPVIIGSGPAGCYTALKIKKLRPIVFEEHKTIGRPVQCAGLLSKRISEIIKIPKKTILNKVKGAKLFSSSESVTIDARKDAAYVIDRAAFDKHLAKVSKADIRLNEPVKSYSLKNGLMQVNTSKQKLKTKLVIDCSGPNKPENYVIGLQARAKLKRDSRFVELHFDCPGFFAWVIPEGNGVCRIGVGVRQKPAIYLNKFLKELGVKKVIEKQAGIIPLIVRQFCHDNLIMVGDSAGQVKPTTGGGVIMGLLSAEQAATSALRAYEANDFSKSFFKKHYQRPWSKTVGRELRLHSMIRRFLNKLDDRGYDLLIRFLSHNKRLIEEHGDMDFPTRFLFKLIRPKNLFYGLRLLPYAFTLGKHLKTEII